MALTPEDVVNKRFQPTKFREGYDQDEVDDFLDEVVVELRRLNQENEELKQRLVAADSRIAELQRSNAPVTGEQAQAPLGILQRVQRAADQVVDGRARDPLPGGDLGQRPVAVEVQLEDLPLVFGQQRAIALEEGDVPLPRAEGVKGHALTA